MPDKKDVKEMIDLCTNLGLDVVRDSHSGHNKVRDPKSNAWLFSISSSPSDPNFKWMIRRHLRRLGLLRQGKPKWEQHKRKYVGAIDLDALKRAQDQAASSGERIPLLEDLEDSTEFFKHVFKKQGPVTIDKGYTHEAQEEAIQIMPLKATPRSNSTKQRLRRILSEKEMSTRDFVAIALEVGEKRELRVWPRLIGGYQALHKFMNESDATMQIWAINLVEATLDHIEGLKFGEIDETRKLDTENVKKHMELVAYVTVEMLEKAVLDLQTHIDTTLGNIEESVVTKVIRRGMPQGESEPRELDHLRLNYAQVLLKALEHGDTDAELIMQRLDKLVGLEL